MSFQTHIKYCGILISIIFMMETYASYDLEYIKEKVAADPISAVKLVNEALLEARAENKVDDILDLMSIQTRILFNQGDQLKLLAVAAEGEKFAIKYGKFDYEVEFRSTVARTYSQMSRWPEAKIIFEQLITLIQKKGDVKQMATVKAAYGVSSYYNGELDNALKQLIPAYEVMRDEDLFGIHHTLNDIGLVYDHIGDYKKAIEFYNKSFEYYDVNKLDYDAMPTYFNIGLAYLNLDDFEKAKEFTEKAELIARTKNLSRGVAFCTAQLGLIAKRQNRLDAAMRYYQESLELAKQLNNNRLAFQSAANLLVIYSKLSLLDSASELDRWVDERFSDKESIILQKLILTGKLELALARRDFESVDRYFHDYDKANNEWLQEKTNKKIEQTQSNFKSQLQEKENEILKQQNKVQQLSIKEQRYMTAIISILSLFLISVIGFMIFNLKRERRVKEQFEVMAMFDELTGVANRRSIMISAKDIVDQFKRYKITATLCLLDLDFFKNINDEFGHDVGDKVLKIFADSASSVIREQDKFGRIGGEEWLLILPCTSIDCVDALFKRLREKINAHESPIKNISITFSMGCTQLKENDDNVDCVIKRADEALYQAKENGRDDYVIA